MSRFLFVVPPRSGRNGPVAAIAREITGRGHHVAWTGDGDLVDAIAVPPGDHADRVYAGGGVRSPTGLLLLWNDHVLPLAHDMLPAVLTAIDAFQPDVLVVEGHTIAGGVAGHIADLPWATVLPSITGVTDPFVDLPGIARKVRASVRRFLREAGLDTRSVLELDPTRSRELVIAFTTEELAGPIDDSANCYELVGPHLSPCNDVSFDWARVALERPMVLVATEPRSGSDTVRLATFAADAATALGLRAVTVGPLDVAPARPLDVAVMPGASTWALARRAAAVVCDANPRIVNETLSQGTPLVLAPETAEQRLVAEQVVGAGAAVRVSATSSDIAELEQAIRTAVTDTRVRGNARRIGDSFTAAGGIPAAADRLEALAAARHEPARRIRCRS